MKEEFNNVKWENGNLIILKSEKKDPIIFNKNTGEFELKDPNNITQQFDLLENSKSNSLIVLRR